MPTPEFMGNSFAVQEIHCQFGSLRTIQEIERALYAGQLSLETYQASIAGATAFFSSISIDGIWLISSALTAVMAQANRQVIPESAHWIADALQYARSVSAQKFHLAAMDSLGMIVVTLESCAQEAAWGWMDVLDLAQRSQVVFHSQKQTRLVELLDARDGNLPVQENFYPTCVLDGNPFEMQNAFTDLFQLCRALLSVKYRTHYAGGSSRITQSFPWFLDENAPRREALLFNTDHESTAIRVLEAESNGDIGFLPGLQSPQLFIISGDDLVTLTGRLDAIQGWLMEGRSLEEVMLALMDSTPQYSTLRLVLIAADAEDLAKECAAAQKGIPGALANQREWQSMNGSYFTPQPLGAEAGVALVYPGAFNSYIGMGRELLHHFPGLQDWFSGHSANPSDLYQAQKIFPPNAGMGTDADQQQMQEDLVSSPLSMLFSGTAIAGLYTHLLRSGFGIQADAALGYSMGETAMLFATGLWTETDAVKDEIAGLPLFHTRLAGPLNAVREHWLTQGEPVPDGDAPIWDNHIVMTTFEKALPVVSAEPQVYLTHINAPRQLIIGGEPEGCKRVLAQLRCMSFPIPYHYPMHCAAIISEYETLRDLHMLPVEREPLLTYYSSYETGRMQMDSSSIADAIAGGLCNRVDFPALVRSAYDDGNRIFIEVGARSNCTKWVENTLKGEAYCALSINQAEVPDLTGVLRVLARLISHGKNVDLRLLAGASGEALAEQDRNPIQPIVEMV